MTNTKKEAVTATTAQVKTQDNSNLKTVTGQEENNILPDIKLWPESVNGEELAEELVSTIKRYVYLPDGAADVAAMWVLHTYISDGYQFSPRLFIHSPEPRCGKTTFLDVLERLCYKPLAVSSITGPSMARMITKNNGQITLLADEVDRYLNNDNDTLCKVLNAGYERGKKIMCVETSGRNKDPMLFDCFAPCALAGIGNIPNTVQDRSLTITMKRKTDSDRVERFRYRKIIVQTTELQQKCKRFIMDNEQEIIKCEPEVPEILSDRAADVSEILFAIAETISHEWYKRLVKSVLTLVKKQNVNNELSVRTQLLVDIWSIFTSIENKWISSSDLVDKLNEIETSPWSEWNKGHPMSTAALARQLKFFGIAPVQHRESYNNRSRKYYVQDFEDAFSRYIPASIRDSVTNKALSDVNCHSVTPCDGVDDLPDMGF